MKSVAIRFPDEMLEWLQQKVAAETILRNEKVSINSYVLELVKNDMEDGQSENDSAEIIASLEAARLKALRKARELREQKVQVDQAVEEAKDRPKH